MTQAEEAAHFVNVGDTVAVNCKVAAVETVNGVTRYVLTLDKYAFSTLTVHPEQKAGWK